MLDATSLALNGEQAAKRAIKSEVKISNMSSGNFLHTNRRQKWRWELFRARLHFASIVSGVFRKTSSESFLSRRERRVQWANVALYCTRTSAKSDCKCLLSTLQVSDKFEVNFMIHKAILRRMKFWKKIDFFRLRSHQDDRPWEQLCLAAVNCGKPVAISFRMLHLLSLIQSIALH